MSSFAIVAIVIALFLFVYSIVKIGVRYSENIERIKHGYPLIDGTRPVKDESVDTQLFDSKLQ